MPDLDDADGHQTGAQGWLNAGVAGIGAASFFSDAGHEVTTALLPSFLTSVLHGSAGALGAVEGASDALLGAMKLVGGRLADEPERRGPVAAGGYLGTALATGAIGSVVAVWQAGALRAVAWMARGLRGPSRDALLASLVGPGAYGRAFGLERAGDNLGAVAGPLLAAGLVRWVGIRPALWYAAIPGVLAALSVVVVARRAPRPVTSTPATTTRTRRRARLDVRGLRQAGLLRPFVPITFFEFGNTATALLILRATQLLHSGGRSMVEAASLAIVVYAAHNAVAAVVAFGGGHWIDRAGPRRVFTAGAGMYVLAYSGFAVGSHAWPVLLVAFALAGSGIGLAEPSESALVAASLPDDRRGSGFGMLGAVQSAGDVVSSVTVGVLYAAVSPVVAFGYAAGWMGLSLLSSSLLAPATTSAPRSAA